MRPTTCMREGICRTPRPASGCHSSSWRGRSPKPELKVNVDETDTELVYDLVGSISLGADHGLSTWLFDIQRWNHSNLVHGCPIIWRNPKPSTRRGTAGQAQPSDDPCRSIGTTGPGGWPPGGKVKWCVGNLQVQLQGKFNEP